MKRAIVSCAVAAVTAGGLLAGGAAAPAAAVPPPCGYYQVGTAFVHVSGYFRDPIVNAYSEGEPCSDPDEPWG
ncbi:hypothetical protein [Jiangella alkaliphila]|uniref:Secreted protein n=1 Tax=Jiangella alkaliphila TaxID=419479 RepID=A0A1H2M7Y6_9ACTN|nr:hypothetical protein [Jiangella alkaliphila]SDU88616.1 hypothetical protein SAMN04488563_7113 [Jiangella alkaliphila]